MLPRLKSKIVLVTLIHSVKEFSTNFSTILSHLLIGIFSVLIITEISSMLPLFSLFFEALLPYYVPSIQLRLVMVPNSEIS